MDRIGSDGDSRLDQGVDVQVGLARGLALKSDRPVDVSDERSVPVPLGVRCGRRDPHGGGGLRDAAGDFTSVRYEQGRDQSRNTP
jgi:hypothetical protein